MSYKKKDYIKETETSETVQELTREPAKAKAKVKRTLKHEEYKKIKNKSKIKYTPQLGYYVEE